MNGPYDNFLMNGPYDNYLMNGPYDNFLMNGPYDNFLMNGINWSSSQISCKYGNIFETSAIKRL
jgi:hypothetical protein